MEEGEQWRKKERHAAHMGGQNRQELPPPPPQRHACFSLTHLLHPQVFFLPACLPAMPWHVLPASCFLCAPHLCHLCLITPTLCLHSLPPSLNLLSFCMHIPAIYALPSSTWEEDSLLSPHPSLSPSLPSLPYPFSCKFLL